MSKYKKNYNLQQANNYKLNRLSALIYKFLNKSFKKLCTLNQANIRNFQMASKYLQKFPIPSGFQQILSDFTREVLRDQPQNIIEYAAKYFEMLEKGQRPQFNSKYNVKKDDKKYELAYNAKNAEDIAKRATNITAKLNQGGNVAPGAPGGSVNGSRQVIGTEKTVTGEETSNYVNTLSNKFAHQQSQQQSLHQAVSQTVQRLFQQIDIDRNGFLSSREIDNFIKEVISQMGENFAFREGDIQSFIDIVDNDRDGKISKAEMIDFIMDLFNSM